MAQQRDSGTTRRGMTLVELLMVLAIMTLLMAVALPMVRPAFQDRKMREAARQLNIFLTSAQSRAAEIGRPVGVWIDVEGTGGEKFAQQVYIAEVPPSFSGSYVGARCTIDTTGARPRLVFWREWDPTVAQAFDADTQLILNQIIDPEIAPGVGEKFFIRFDHKGPLYLCENEAGVFYITIPGTSVPRGTEHPTTPPQIGDRPVGLTYEIIRSPSKSAVSPLTMPGDTVIDLTASGVGVGIGAGSTSNGFNGASSGGRVIIMFAPSGKTGAVFVDFAEFDIGASIYLLVGRRAKVLPPQLPPPPPDTINPDIGDPEKSNLADPDNLWVTINNRTGTITTQDKAVPDSTIPTVPTTIVEYQAYLTATREFARGSRQKGGR